MGDAGGPGSARKCPQVALANLGDTEGFDKGGEEGQLYTFELSDGVYKRKKKKGHHPRGRWGAEARRVERRRCFICRPQMAPPAGVYQEQVGGLCRPHTTDGVADRHSNLLSLRRNGLRTQGWEGDKCRYPAVFLRS